MTRYGSRKFILCALTLAAATWLVSVAAIDAATFKAVVLGTVGVYVAGNVAQKAWAEKQP